MGNETKNCKNSEKIQTLFLKQVIFSFCNISMVCFVLDIMFFCAFYEQGTIQIFFHSEKLSSHSILSTAKVFFHL